MKVHTNCLKCGKNIVDEDTEPIQVQVAMWESGAAHSVELAICLDCIGDRDCDELRCRIQEVAASLAERLPRLLW